jgi:hypothetical protein
MNISVVLERGTVVLATLVVMTSPAAGQATARAPGQGEAKAPARASAYSPPRTPDGQPDISGMWEPGPGRPMEKPRGEAWHPPVVADGSNGAAYTFFAPGDALPGGRATDRSPMIFDPPDAIIPLQPWAVAKRDEIIAHQENVQLLDPRVRCLQAGVPRANLPVFYNSYQILQTPGSVVILYEWNHMTRVIPLDGRPHLPAAIRLANGDSRGRWEGNTLVVDVTNFTGDTWVVGHGAPPEGAPASSLTSGHGVIHTEALHVVELFTRVDPATIRYEATIEDPKVFTRPWKFALDAFVRAKPDHQLFEYACHEGNRSNVLLVTGADIGK